MGKENEVSSIIGTVRRMSNKDLAAVGTLIVFCVSAAFWIENRYAKLADTQMRIEQQQTEIIQLQTQILNVVNALPDGIRKEIIERSAVSRALNPERRDNYIPQQNSQHR